VDLEHGRIVDLEHGRIVDLLPDRSAQSVARWLREHPGVQTASRGRAGVYADGTRQGAPKALQVANRWRLMKNLADALERVLVLAASNALYARHISRDLPWFSDPGAYSPEEGKAVSEAVNTRGTFLPELKLPLSKLTPA